MKQIGFVTKSAMLGVLAVVALNGVAHASTVQVNTRGGIGETDFISWNAVAGTLGTGNNLSNPTAVGTFTTVNGNVGFGFSQLPHFGNPFNFMTLSHVGSLDGGDASQRDLKGETGNVNAIDLTFASSFQAIGFDFVPNNGGNAGYMATLNVYTGMHTLIGTLGLTSPNASPLFFGVMSNNLTPDINEITIGSTGTSPFAIDRVSLNAPAAPAGVPEPGTCGLLFLGVAAVFGYARKRVV